MENGICGQGAMGICSMAWLCMGTYIERCPGTSTWLSHRCVPTRTGTRDTALVSAGSSWCCITPQLSMYLSAYSTYIASRRMHAGMRNGCMTRCPGTALAHNTSTPQHNTSCCPPILRPPAHARCRSIRIPDLAISACCIYYYLRRACHSRVDRSCP